MARRNVSRKEKEKRRKKKDDDIEDVDTTYTTAPGCDLRGHGLYGC